MEWIAVASMVCSKALDLKIASLKMKAFLCFFGTAINIEKYKIEKIFFGGLALNPGIEIQDHLIGWLATKVYTADLGAEQPDGKK